MTKKDYQAIARVINNRFIRTEILNNYQVALFADDLAEVFLSDNVLFDRVRFQEACLTGKCKGMRA